MSKYVYKPYSELFPQLFEREKERIQGAMIHIAQIEHIGSTAVPHLGGKGIIDLGVAVPRAEMERVKDQLIELGYEFRPAWSTEDRFYFIIYLPDPEEGERRYHLHLTYPECREWKEFLFFRDYLREHPEEAKEYAEVKRKAALDAKGEGEVYRKIKESLIRRILSQRGAT